MRTACKITWGFYDVDAKSSIHKVTASDVLFLDGGALRMEKPEYPKYMTSERNYARADGTFIPVPDTEPEKQAGFWSMAQSGADRKFPREIELDILLNDTAFSSGITLVFDTKGGDYASDIFVEWFRDYDEDALDERDRVTYGRFFPDAPVFFCDPVVSLEQGGYKRVRITFSEMNKPYRFLKLSDIVFGRYEEIQSKLLTASVTEQADPNSSEIPINELQFSMADPNISLFRPKGDIRVLEQPYPFDVYFERDGQDTYMGRYYLEDWETGADGISTMKAVDAVGRLDKAAFQGDIYFNKNAGELVAKVFDQYMDKGYIEYELDEALAGQTLSGWLPDGTIREALQQIAFALGAVVDCSRSHKIRIYAPERVPPPDRPYIGADRRSLSQSLKLSERVTHVSVLSHEYVLDDTIDGEKELFKDDNMTPGAEVWVEFKNPSRVSNSGHTGATVLMHTANRAKIRVGGADPGKETASVVIKGREYIDNSSEYQFYSQNAGLYEKKMIRVDKAYLVNKNRAWQLAQDLYAYYQNRYENTFEAVLGDETPARMLTVFEEMDRRLHGAVLSMETDLTGGGLSKIQVRGIMEPAQPPAPYRIHCGATNCMRPTKWGTWMWQNRFRRYGE